LKAELQNPAGEAEACTFGPDDIFRRFNGFYRTQKNSLKLPHCPDLKGIFQ
jgi:hypothetical protein